MVLIKGARRPFALDAHIETILPPLPARAAPPHSIHAAVLLPTAGMAYAQNFDTLASSGTASAVPAGWAFSETGVSGNAFYSTGGGVATTGDTYSFGIAGAHAVGDRAFGELRSATVIPVLGAGFANGTGGAISTFAISYVGEQWRLGALSRTIADRLDFQISFDATSLTTGSWTDVNALDFAPPVTAGAVGALDGNLAANRVAISFTIAGLELAAGAGFWIRWIDVDASGADDGLAIDDFSLIANGPGALAIDDVARAEGDSGTTGYVFTVTRSGGSAGAVGATWTLLAPGGAGTAGSEDFASGQAFTGAVSFADGEISRTILVAVAGDLLFETDEGFTILLSAPTGGAAIADASGAGTILNDDPPPPPTVDLSAADPGTGFAQVWAEGGPGRAIGGAIFVASPGGTILRATIAIADAVAGDRLDLADALPAGIVASGAGSATLTLTGLASTADYALALGLILYASDSDDPDLGGTDAERMIAVVVNDGARDSAAAIATIAIDAQSPATIAGEDSGAVTEDDPAPATGLLTVADPDAGEAALVPIPAGTAGDRGHGTFEVLAGGRWTYALNDDDAAVQALGAGATLTDTIMVISADGSATHLIAVTIHGANDEAAIGGADAGSVAEDGALAASGLLTIQDADAGESAFEAFAARPGVYGVFSLTAEGAWAYALDNANAAVQALHDGETLSDVVTVAAIDGTTHELTIAIAGSSDAPAGTDRSIALEEDGAYVFATADFGFSDPAENDALAAVAIASLPGQGLLLLDGMPVILGQAIAVAEIEAGRLRFVPAADAHGAPYAGFAFQVRDAHGESDPTPNSVTFDVVPVNDAPAGADASITGSENDAYVFTLADFGFSDGIEGDAFLAVRIATLPGAGALVLGGGLVTAGDYVSASAIAAGQLSFVPEPGGFGTAYASFAFQVRDDGGTANGGVDLDPTPNLMAIDLAADNDDPALDLDSAAPGVDAALSYTENDGVAAIVPRATLTDDSADFGGGAISVHFAANGTTDDRLSIAAGGGIGISPTDDVLRWNGVAIGFWSGGANGGDLVVLLNADASAAAVEAVLHAFTYANGSEAPSALPRTLTVTVSDGDGGSANADLVIGVVPVDDAPVAGNDAFATDEATAIAAANLFANDADVDGPALVVMAVNGAAAAVGQQIALASGALLTVRADGTFDYDPNHAFDRTPFAASGAANAIAHDGFAYTLANGNSATVALAIAGLDSDDFALGTAGADVIDAGAGSDTIDGLTGADRLAGGAGNDFIFVDGDDVVIEAAGGGYDNVWARASYVLSAGAEVEVLSTANHAGIAAINLTGNDYANVLIGNDGANLLDGAGGADRLAGRGGDDVLIVDSGDVVDEQAGGGYDNVCARSDYVLSAGAFVEVLSTTSHAGIAAINLTGNERANIVIGNAGANILDGGPGGIDRLAGLGGDDVLIVDAGDVVDEQAGGGYDNVCARSSYMLSAGAAIEVLSTTDHAGTAAIDLTGNELGQVIIGNAGANVLDGGLGADRLAGFGGADIFAFSTALGAGNVDTIADFDGDDLIRLDHAIFAGLGLGALAAGAFVAGTAAADADDRILYDATAGQIFYDADGNGANAAILFATVVPTTIVTAGDFLVI